MGLYIRGIRKQLKLRNKEFAQILQISNGSLTSIERGRRALKMSEFLNLYTYLKNNTKIDPDKITKEFFSIGQ